MKLWVLWMVWEAAILGSIIGFLMDCILVLNARTTVGATGLDVHLTACGFGLSAFIVAVGFGLPAILYANLQGGGD
jgi:hypothetical protein